MLNNIAGINTSPAFDSFIKKENKKAQEPVAKPEIEVNNEKYDKMWAAIGLLGAAGIIASAIMCDAKKGTNRTTNIVQNQNNEKLSNIWEDISKCKTIEEMALPKTLKSTLEKLIKCIENPEIIEQRGGKSIKTILLYGPPGTGKTTFAKAIAKYFPDSKYAGIDVTSLNSKWVGETEKNVQKAVVEICEQAEKNPNTKYFVFIDEIDSIMMIDEGSAKKHSNDVLNEFKRCFTEKLGKHENIITIGATNVPIDVEKGITMGGKQLDRPMLDRFEQKILVDLPTSEQIKEAFIMAYKDKKLVDESLFQKDSKQLETICDFLSNKKHNVSFRTVNSIVNETASAIQDDTRKVTIQDIFNTIVEKRHELNIKYDTDLRILAERLGVEY